jgi:Concanavalin A-like lectin/glucanases superfamily
MVRKRFIQLTELTTPSSSDYLPIADTSANEDKFISVENFFNGGNLPEGFVDTDQLSDDLAQGYNSLAVAPSAVTYNGNRSYSLTFPTTDYTAIISAAMRLRLIRTVTAPTRCTDLESGSSQYFSKTSPAGLSFTTTYTCMAWIKLESYTGASQGVIARRNADTEGWSLSILADGRVELYGLRIAANNKVVQSYQSVPLGEWVHIAASMDMTAGASTGGLIYIDGVLVPSVTTQTGTATALVQGTTALVVGARKSAGSETFDGKIAQAAVFSTVLSDTTIRSYISQGLAGTETSLVSAYSFNSVITDLNTTSANNLSAVASAVATNVDSPFSLGADLASGYTAGTTDFAIVSAKPTFSTNTTVVVQVPKGCTIPTSGGVASVDYSLVKVPYGFPCQKGRWQVGALLKTDTTQSSAVNGTWYNIASLQVAVPIGDWALGYFAAIYAQETSGPIDIRTTLSTSSSTESDSRLSARSYGVTLTELLASITRQQPVNVASATPYYLLNMANSAGNTALQIAGSLQTAEIFADFAYL